MKKNILFTSLSILVFVNLLSAQFIVKNVTFSPNGISNQGKVAGYETQAGPYAFWLPDSGNVISQIGGIAPGNGVGGQARFSTNGNFISGTSMGIKGPEMSKYDRATNLWTTVGSLGFPVDSNVSGGFAISGDGNTVAGLSWADTSGGHAYSHAVASNLSEGLMDLGSLFDSIQKSTRANAVSYDGNVIVGWQDYNGPWKSAVWKKNPAGGYFPNHYILIDTTASPYDEFNQMGECSAVSADGNWIGGYGDFANNYQPWIWSKDSGIINLGTLPNTGNGYVSGMSADASIVVGWFDGQLWGDPLIPFIWTSTGGLQELNGYINTVLGYSTNPHQVYTADCISADGHFIAGYGVDTSTFTYFVYRLGLTVATHVREASTTHELTIYPNPTSGLFTIENTGKAVLTIRSMDGRFISQSEWNQTIKLDMSTYPKGVYSLSLQSNNFVRNQKVVIN